MCKIFYTKSRTILCRKCMVCTFFYFCICKNVSMSYNSGLPCSQNTKNVQKESSLHHIRRLEGAGTVDNCVRSRGHGKHECVTDANGAGHHQVEGVDAEGQGHLGQDGNEDVGAGCVAGHLRQKGGDKSDNEADQQRIQFLK